MNNMKKFFTFLSLVLVIFLVIFNFTLAATTPPLEYTPLVSLDLEGGAASKITATTYIENFFTVFMAVIVAMALFKVVSGGIKLMFAGDNPSMKGEGRKDIEGALYGLILALLTYTILYKVNPRLIPGSSLFSFELEAPKAKSE
jgi:hypothetical protein